MQRRGGRIEGTLWFGVLFRAFGPVPALTCLFVFLLSSFSFYSDFYFYNHFH